MLERLLILGGTAEAARLARLAVQTWGDRLEVMTSLAGRLKPSPVLPGRVRIGGFGGPQGLADCLCRERIDWVIDATHPFAETISRNAAEACEAVGVPRATLVRPPWRPHPGDRWLEVDGFAEAAEALPRVGRRAFLTTGPGRLDAFASVADVWFLVRLFVRLFEPAEKPLPLANALVVVARPPFTPESEHALLTRHRIAALVTKQSGGPTEAKLIAARETGLPVVMIRRPPPPPGDRVETVEAALAWLHARIQAADARSRMFVSW